MSTGMRSNGPAASAATIVYETVAGAGSAALSAASAAASAFSKPVALPRRSFAYASSAAFKLLPARPSISPGEKWARSSNTWMRSASFWSGAACFAGGLGGRRERNCRRCDHHDEHRANVLAHRFSQP